MAPATTTCHACGKSGAKLLRCGRCHAVWFCNRECQVVAARQGHAGANCRAVNAPTAHEAADSEAASRLPAAAGPSTTGPGSDASTMASAAASCHACGKSGGKLLLCGRCRNVWFCNRECQVVARQEIGHRGANCRPADGVQRPSISASTEAMPVYRARPGRRHHDLIDEADRAKMANTRIGFLAASEKYRQAATVADLIGGAEGALRCADAEKMLSGSLVRLGDLAAAARAACSSLRAARASGSRTVLVTTLSMCGDVARAAPGEMASAERESREQEKLSGSPSSFGGLDLSKEGRISLPTTPAALSRLGLAYFEAAVAICDAAGGRGSPTANEHCCVPLLGVEAEARGGHGRCLYHLGEERQRSLELLRHAVALRRQVFRTAAPGQSTLEAQQMLAHQLSILAAMGYSHPSKEVTEAEACLREALALGEGLGDVFLTGKTLLLLINLCGEAHAMVRPAEAEAFRLRLNQVLSRWADRSR